MNLAKRLILASGSRFRKQILERTGLIFESIPPKFDERSIHLEDPRELALELSKAKAQCIAEKFPDSIIIGADQTLGFEGKLLYKASSKEEAFETLQMLGGRSHFLYSAVTLIFVGSKGKSSIANQFVVPIEMKIRPLTDHMIEKYVGTDEWRGCVGCYQVENKGSHLFERYDADESTIMGLPLIPLLQALREIGVDALESFSPPWRIN